MQVQWEAAVERGWWTCAHSAAVGVRPWLDTGHWSTTGLSPRPRPSVQLHAPSPHIPADKQRSPPPDCHLEHRWVPCHYTQVQLLETQCDRTGKRWKVKGRWRCCIGASCFLSVLNTVMLSMTALFTVVVYIPPGVMSSIFSSICACVHTYVHACMLMCR